MIQAIEDENTIDSLSAIESPMVLENSIQDKFMRKLTAAFRQLGELVDYETQALRTHSNPDFNDINAKKARSLQTLSQLSSEGEGIALDESCKADIHAQLDELQAKLTCNQQLLQTHIEAVNELIGMIHAAADAQETDGTYDPYFHAKQAYRG